MSEEAYPSENARRLATAVQRERYETLTELTREGVRIVKVKATVEFEAYSRTSGFGTGTSMEQRISEEIASAIGYRAPNGADLELGDALIIMANATPPDFAVQVTKIDVLPTHQPVDPDLVVEEAITLTNDL